MHRLSAVRRRAIAVPAVVALVLSVLTVSLVGSVAASADPVGPQQRPTGLVTSDSLPTTQINGVAWAQAIAGSRVYAGGQFTSARPAGAALGTGETSRSNFLAYDLASGNLISSYAPVVNNAVRAIAVSPDGSRVYIGGSFTSIDGVARYRLAALDAATGALITSFAAGVDYTINSIVATNTTVYVGGAFSTVGTSPRTRLAAFSASNGALLAWAPAADNGIQTMVLSPDGTKLVVGGSFTTLTSTGSTTPTPSMGIGAIDASTGVVVQPWNTNLAIRNGGANGAITALSSDGTSIFGGGYKYGTGSNFEGTFKLDPKDGSIQWIEDCHGDVYGVYASPVAMYEVGHSHYCGNDMGWPQPATWNFNRGVAFTKNATGTLTRDAIGGGYTNFGGTPSPSLLSWFPRLDVGTYTGKSQAAWSVTGNAQYVLLGGEFPLVNNAGQQGLARFAVTPSTGKKQGVRISGAAFVPTLTSPAAGKVRIQFKANWDRDDRNLTYTIQRTAPTAATVYTTTVASSEWDRPTIGFIDSGLKAGDTATYQIRVVDPDGNSATGNSASVTVAGSGGLSSYGDTVLSQGASLYWPLNETAGTTAYDYAGFNDGTLNTGVTTGAAGAITGDTAMTFSGALGGDLAGQSTLTPPNTFTAEAWFKTTSVQGGRILGFSDLATENSAHRDRQIYMSNTGKLSFGVYSNAANFLTSSKSYNDGVWHQAVAVLSPAGMSLYVDGARVGQRSDVTFGEMYPGYWKIGGDSTGGWNNAGTSGYFAGSIDEVSIYPTALSFQQINAQYAASGRSITTAAAPSDAYGAMIYADEPTAYWRLSEAAGVAAAPDSGPVNNAGTYVGGVTKGAAGAISGTPNTAVTVNGSTGFISSNASFANPTAYSTEAWFKTTTTTGGSIVDFGNARTGTSTTSDRKVYMQNDGRLAFGAGTTPVVITSPNPYNNGQWHHVVATQGASGMVLYVDGAQVASSSNAGNANYTGYWRAGGDLTGGSTSNYLNGTIDEVAIYNSVLPAARVAQHFTTGTGGGVVNSAPTAAFSTVPTNLSVAFDASASTDSDGTIATYAWNFGDQTTGTGVSPTHLYTAAGTYNVVLTVTDNQGGTGTKTLPVTVTAANAAPTSSFTFAPTNLVVAFDGAGSSDPDGTIASYAWDFGDGTTGTGATVSHTYTTAGTRTVTLVVTDNSNATGTSTKSVTVSAGNVAPTAAFTVTAANLAVSFDGAGSSDPDGTITSYAWDFGDGTTGTGATASHTYTTAGTRTVTLVVTDNSSTTGTLSKSVTVSAANTPPTSSFTFVPNNLAVTFDGSGSSDSDGTIATYAWTFSDGGTATGPKPTYTFPAAGPVSATLVVTDNQSATGSSTQNFTVTAPAGNTPPTALISQSTSGLAVNVNGSGSSDPDGTIASHAWNFGDGATGTGATASHTYAAAGTYTVTLTVTDNLGATGTKTATVTVSAALAVFAKDSFARTVASGWGSAETGGAWTVPGVTNNPTATVAAGAAKLPEAAGSTRTGTLASVSQSNVDIRLTVSLDKLPAGGSTMASAVARKSGSGEYRATATFSTTPGKVNLQIVRLVGTTSTAVGTAVTLTNVTYTAGADLNLRLVVNQTSPTTTQLQAKGWTGVTEPTTWAVSGIDTQAAASVFPAGSVGVVGYASGSATNAPVTISYKNLNVQAVGAP